MNYFEAPIEYEDGGYCVFLAGSISDPGNWQMRLVKELARTELTILNPRRRQFPTGDRAEERRQIEWERRHLARADLVIFWLTPPTLCPIALFELGACCEANVPLVVGVDPNYALEFDIDVHLGLRRPDVKVLDNLNDVAHAILTHAATVENAR
jgi:hypothetical protein